MNAPTRARASAIQTKLRRDLNALPMRDALTAVDELAAFLQEYRVEVCRQIHANPKERDSRCHG